MVHSSQNRSGQLVIAAMAAFATYFCMYAFRKPFSAGVYAGQEVFGFELKSTLVIAQLVGYMLSKFIGIKIVSEMSARHRAVAIVGLIVLAEAALVGFAYLPVPFKVLMLFLNGLPLGMIFGLVLAYLEGRQQTEALSAALCASFIISSGVVKSVGRWLIVDMKVSEFQMPMLTGLMFFPPLLIAVWLLQQTPLPDVTDHALRTERKVMTRTERLDFYFRYWPGLTLLLFVYVALTIIRSIRDDFGVEIWAAMVDQEVPSVFSRTETLVAIFVTLLSAFTILVRDNLTAMKVTIGLMCVGFCLVAGSALAQGAGRLTPFAFMVVCGIGMYIPYVAFHTTVFERLIAASRRPSNLGFLMYLADTVGYLGYTVVLVFKSSKSTPTDILPFFRGTLIIVAIASILALLAAIISLQKTLTSEANTVSVEPATIDLALADS